MLTAASIQVCCPPREKTRLFGLARHISEATATQHNQHTIPAAPQVPPAAVTHQGPLAHTPTTNRRNQQAPPTTSRLPSTTANSASPAHIPTPAITAPGQLAAHTTPVHTPTRTPLANRVTSKRTPSATAVMTPPLTRAGVMKSPNNRVAPTCAAGYQNRKKGVGCGGCPSKTVQFFDTYGQNTKKAGQLQASCRSCRSVKKPKSSSVPLARSPTSPDHSPSPKKRPCHRKSSSTQVSSSLPLPTSRDNVIPPNCNTSRTSGVAIRTHMPTPTDTTPASNASDSASTATIPWHLQVMANTNGTNRALSPLSPMYARNHSLRQYIPFSSSPHDFNRSTTLTTTTITPL